MKKNRKSGTRKRKIYPRTVRPIALIAYRTFSNDVGVDIAKRNQRASISDIG